jgi:hypothetical protein
VREREREDDVFDEESVKSSLNVHMNKEAEEGETFDVRLEVNERIECQEDEQVATL